MPSYIARVLPIERIATVRRDRVAPPPVPRSPGEPPGRWGRRVAIRDSVLILRDDGGHAHRIIAWQLHKGRFDTANLVAVDVHHLVGRQLRPGQPAVFGIVLQKAARCRIRPSSSSTNVDSCPQMVSCSASTNSGRVMGTLLITDSLRQWAASIMLRTDLPGSVAGPLPPRGCRFTAWRARRPP